MEDERSPEAEAIDSALPADEDFDDGMTSEDDLSSLTFDEADVDEAVARITDPPAPSAAAPAAPKAPSGPAAAPAKPTPAAPVAAPPAAGAPVAPAEGAPTPFTIRADRATHAFEGAELRADGLFIPKGATLERVQKLLGSGIAHEGSFQRTLTSLHQRAQAAEQEVVRAKAEVNEEVERAKAQNAFWAELYAKGPDAVAEHLDNFGRSKDLIEARIAQQIARREKDTLLGLKGGTAGQPAPAAPAPSESGDDVEVDDVKLRESLGGVLDDVVASNPDLQLLTDDDRKDLIDYLGSEAMLPRLFFVAERDYPDKGIYRGDVIADSAVIVKEGQRLARIRKEASVAREADDRNKARLRTPGAPPVPAGGGSAGGGGAAPSGGGVRGDQAVKRTFKSKAEFDAYFNETPIAKQIEDAGRRKRGA